MSQYILEGKNERFITTGTGNQVINILDFAATEVETGSVQSRLSWSNVPSVEAEQYKTGEKYEISIVKVVEVQE